MKRFVEGQDRRQTTQLPDWLDDYVGEEDNPDRRNHARCASASQIAKRQAPCGR